jgi:SulP family sulfate permease
MTSTIISQLVLSLGGSSFLGANGSMMIEIIPFLHRITLVIARRHPASTTNNPIIVSTVLFCFALSTILTGLTFLLLGVLKVGNFVNFFPRSFLIGTVGGIAVFLIQTALELSVGNAWEWSLEFFKRFIDPQILPIWLSCVALTALLKLVQRKWKSSMLIPLYYLSVAAAFYVIAMGACGYNAQELRRLRWLLSMESPSDGGSGNWDLETLFSLWLKHISLGSIDWPSVGAALPTIGTLVLFGLLHVPLNVRV